MAIVDFISYGDSDYWNLFSSQPGLREIPDEEWRRTPHTIVMPKPSRLSLRVSGVDISKVRVAWWPDSFGWQRFSSVRPVPRIAGCNHIGYTCRCGDQEFSTQGDRAVLRHWSDIGNSSETRRSPPPYSRPVERLRQRARYEPSRFGTPRTSWLPKRHVGREGERQLARNVLLAREGRRSRRLRGLPLR